jgi:hypothetical protein
VNSFHDYIGQPGHAFALVKLEEWIVLVLVVLVFVVANVSIAHHVVGLFG